MDLNGRKLKFFLQEGEWQVINETLREYQVVELGIKTHPTAPVAFPRSWGRGLLMSEFR